MSASIGISLYPQDGDEPGSLLRNADAAMLESKKGGHAYVVSNRGALDSSAKLRFVTRLRKAVESQRWTLHYQPVLDLATGRMRGVEALIRWIEADGTMVPPGDFIPVAEELGLIEAIGDWVVRELVYQSQAWRELDIDLSVSFNLSPVSSGSPTSRRGSSNGSGRAASIRRRSSSRSRSPRRWPTRIARKRSSRISTPVASGSRSTTSGPATPPSPGSGRCRWTS